MKNIIPKRIKTPLIIVVLLALVVAGAFSALRGADKTDSAVPKASTAKTAEQKGTDVEKPVELSSDDAKKVAENYLAARKQCDLALANTYRMTPEDASATKVAECKQQCPEGTTYKFVQQQAATDKKEQGGVTTEIVHLKFDFACGERKYPSLVSMIKVSIDNKWKVLGIPTRP